MLIKCQQKLAAQNVDWRTYYSDSETKPDSVDIILYQDQQDDGHGKDWFCGLVLKDCNNAEKCNCANEEIPIIFQEKDGNWKNEVNCTTMKAYNGPEQRTISDDDKEKYSGPVQSSVWGVVEEVPPANRQEFERMAREADTPYSPVDIHTPSTMIAEAEPANNPQASTNTKTTATAKPDDANILEVDAYKDLVAALDDVGPEGRSLDTATDQSSPEDLTTTPEATEESISTEKSFQPQQDDTGAEEEETTVKDTTTTTTTTPTADSDDKKDEDAAGLADLSSLQTKYYVVVVFVIIFVIILVVIGAVIFYKMKKSRASHQIISPGPGDNEPLTPGASASPAFNFDKTR